MSENGISGKRNRIFKAITDSNENYNIAPNLLNRGFSTDRSKQTLSGYIWEASWNFIPAAIRADNSAWSVM
jgi:hypothetical protein